MGTERSKDALLATLIIASLMLPAISLLSVIPSSASPAPLVSSVVLICVKFPRRF